MKKKLPPASPAKSPNSPPAKSVLAAKKAPPRRRVDVAAKPPAPVAESKPAKAAKQVKLDKTLKKDAERGPRLVRDSFTMPANDFALIATLKTRALSARRAAKKSELLRAGLRALAALAPKALVEALDGLEAVKVGRPKKPD